MSPSRAIGFMSFVLAALSITVFLTPSASAGNCTGPACGRVWNWTNSEIRLASLGKDYPARCAVRSWPDKHKVTDAKKDGKIACKTAELGPGGYSGNKMKDTDAFTFHRKFSLGGVEYSDGTYVKINDLAQVTCVNIFNSMPRCKFLGT